MVDNGFSTVSKEAILGLLQKSPYYWNDRGPRSVFRRRNRRRSNQVLGYQYWYNTFDRQRGYGGWVPIGDVYRITDFSSSTNEFMIRILKG